jgi:hypothetical protein
MNRWSVLVLLILSWDEDFALLIHSAIEIVSLIDEAVDGLEGCALIDIVKHLGFELVWWQMWRLLATYKQTWKDKNM